MWNVFDNFAVDMFGELHRPLCPAGGTHAAALTGERYQERVLAAVAVHAGRAVSEDAAVKVFIEGFGDLVS